METNQVQNETINQEFENIVLQNLQAYHSRNANKNIIKYAFSVCKICSDKSSGIHYGVESCEGCKGFFKRSISIYRKFVCRSNKKCDMNSKQRRNCKFCRWKACINAGMSFGAVKMGRIPDHVKKKQLKEIKTNEREITSKDEKINVKLNENVIDMNDETYIGLQMPKLNLKELIEEKLDIFKTTDPSKLFAKTICVDHYLNTSKENNLLLLTIIRDKSQQIFKELNTEYDIDHYEKAQEIINKNYKFFYDFTPEFLKLSLKKDMIAVSRHAKTLGLMLKELPGFDKLDLKDQAAIIKENFFSTIIIRTVKLFIDDEYYFMLDEQTQLNKEALKALYGQKISHLTIIFGKKIKRLDLTQKELALLIPFVLTWKGSNVSQKEVLRELNEHYWQALVNEFSLSNRNENFRDSFFQMIGMISEFNKACESITYNEVYD